MTSNYIKVATLGVLTLLGVAGCSLDGLLDGDPAVAQQTVDPRKVSTYPGAIAIYNSSIDAMARAMVVVSRDVGLFTDELSVTEGSSVLNLRIDGRFPTEGSVGLASGAYGALQTARVRAQQAAEALLRFGGATSSPLVGHAYALEAHAVLLLAEMFCSGIPLTSVPFEHDLRYTPGFSTDEMLIRAVALFDTAYGYGKDSLPIATFAQVGKGRALTDLGRYEDAANAVSDVQTDAKYSLLYSALTNSVPFWTIETGEWSSVQVLSPEGTNGIPWAAETALLQDPRVPLTTDGNLNFTNPLREVKYRGPSADFVVADGIQARLIAAEYQLHPADDPNGPWPATVNAARATIGLQPLSDPGTAAARIDLLFRERGFWFYLDGMRLGDLRRLVRQYGRVPTQVYPVGIHPRGSPLVPTYGNAYVFVPDGTEQQYNPLYKGCLSRDP